MVRLAGCYRRSASPRVNHQFDFAGSLAEVFSDCETEGQVVDLVSQRLIDLLEVVPEVDDGFVPGIFVLFEGCLDDLIQLMW